MLFITIGFISYLLFFIIFPGIGAFDTRRRWGYFRQILGDYSLLPHLSYKNLKKNCRYIFEGRLESFKSDNVVWLSSQSVSLCVDLKAMDLYMLNQGKLIRNNWENILSMVEGTSFLVIGELRYVNGVPFLVGDKSHALFVVVLDKPYKNFEPLIEKARDKNEMWNSYTPYSYITGVLLLIILSYFAYKSSYDKIHSYLLLVAAGTPFYFILPPGLFFYLKYRKLWDISIRYSVLRDLYKFKNNVERYERLRIVVKGKEMKSLLMYISGYVLNIIVAGTILYKMYQLLIQN